VREQVLNAFVENGRFLDDALKAVSSIVVPKRASSVFWTYSFLSDRRDELLDRLVKRGVVAQRLHLRNDTYSCFRQPAVNRRLLGTDSFDDRTLSIPCGWWVDSEVRQQIVQAVAESV
jgi:dTDP-4-amino-4,6-dideoxygalactose transaminase